jgi:uncharacterized protein (DUF488 family)
MSDPLNLFTIGFTKKSARRFFTKLKDAGVKRVLDVRLNNVSQLAGFAKKDDLEFFLEAIDGIGYTHLTALAPTQSMLDAYKKQKGDWSVYAQRFLDLMRERKIEETLPKDVFEGGCLLCSEDKPHHCHRKLVADYLAEKWGNVRVTHIV